MNLSRGFSTKKAHEMQLRLSKQVRHEDLLPETINYIGGVDVAYIKEVSIGAVSVLDFASLTLIESKVVHLKTRFPYISTLLAFREIPPVYSAIRKLRTKPDVFLVDGQGFAHPYRLGFASHLGLVIDRPTIGVAKSLLCGKVEPIGQHGWFPIMDKEEVIGGKVVTKSGKKPIYISVGHQVSLGRSIEVVKSCTRTCRIPEPLRQAHIFANVEKHIHTLR